MTTITAPEAPMTDTLPTGLVVGEPFEQAVGGRGFLRRFTIAPITYVADGIEEPAGVLVSGEPHRLCRRCSIGYGHYAFNGEHDRCYECDGEGYGADSSFEDLARLAKNRVASRRRVAEKAEREARERAEALAAWKAANADVAEALVAHLPGLDAFDEWQGYAERRPATTFLARLAVQVEDDRKPLSDRQTEAVREVLAKKAAEVVAECPEGRVTIEGIVVSVKEVENAFSYYGGVTFKITVKDDRGFRVYGTLPSSISEADKGSRVRFTATVERSDRDADFGFYKRPTKAEILPAE